MDSPPPSSKRSTADYNQQCHSPVRRILSVHDRGLIFESAQPFEIASAIKLGFHLESEAPGELTRTEFIALEGMVVGCLLCAANDGVPVYEVTLLIETSTAPGSFVERRFHRLMQHSSDEAEGGVSSATSFPAPSSCHWN